MTAVSCSTDDSATIQAMDENALVLKSNKYGSLPCVSANMHVNLLG